MPSKKRLVILGTGFGAVSLLKDLDYTRYAVTVISPRNHFVFTPLLPSTTVGTIEFRSIAEPIRRASKHSTFLQAEATALDMTQNIVQCQSELTGERTAIDVPFDVLVIAVGAANNTFGIEGVKEHAIFLKDLADARRIRQKIIENVERAALPTQSDEERKRLLHFVVVGGGPTGVEFAAELADLLKDDLKPIYPDLIALAEITLVEAGKQLLNSFDAALSTYTLKIFQRQGINTRLNTAVEKVLPNELVFKGGETKGGETLNYGLLVWATGNAATDFVKTLPFEKDRGGRIITTRQLQVPTATNVFALGDATALKDYAQPATAQVAMQQGAYLAKLLNRGLPLETLAGNFPAFERQNFGMLAYIGDNEALADLPVAKGSGFLTWLFWRMAYLTRLVSWKNKAQVLFDWVKAAIFGRDLNRF
jgi:NADH:ubiquinone reductase (non-electrogenic)